MNPHKLAVLRAWWAYPMEPYEGSEVDRLQGHPPFVLGGAAVEEQVRDLLEREERSAREVLEEAMESERGREWWATYVDAPPSAELHETMTMAVPRRRAESDADYETRLSRIETAYRARLPTYVRSTLGSPT